MSGRVVVDYEELHRMSRVWASAARQLADQAAGTLALVGTPAIAENALFDPSGAARVEAAILEVGAGPHGLGWLAGRLALDAGLLEAAVTKERLVDDLPATQVADLLGWLATAWYTLPTRPAQTLRAGLRDTTRLADAGLGYVAPYAEPLLAAFAPAPVLRGEILAHAPVTVDPLFDLPLRLVETAIPEGPGVVVRSTYRPAWAGEPPPSLSSAMNRVADLELRPEADLAVQQVIGADGVCRYVIELPGMRQLAPSSDPLDLPGAIDAESGVATSYTRCVDEALDAAGVPQGAQVMLVGHSEGGIVAMDLAGDPAFNGGRVEVTHVIAAGSPISTKQPVAGSNTRVLSVENVNDIVTHLDGVDSASLPQTPLRLTYQFAADDHDVMRTHAADRYAAQLAQLDDSPNPLARGFLTSAAPYFSGRTSTTVFAMHDAPADTSTASAAQWKALSSPKGR